jgi:hypothetical protein
VERPDEPPREREERRRDRARVGLDAAVLDRDRLSLRAPAVVKASWAAVGVDAVSTAVPGISRIGGKVVREVRTRRGTVVVYRVEGTPNRRIVLDADNNVRFQKRSMLHVAVGQRAYAERYYAKKVRDGLPGAQLKSFRIPRSEHEALRLRAVAQADAKKFPRSPQVVDPTQAPDLYGLRRSDFRQLQETIVPGSGRVVR